MSWAYAAGCTHAAVQLRAPLFRTAPVAQARVGGAAGERLHHDHHRVHGAWCASLLHRRGSSSHAASPRLTGPVCHTVWLRLGGRATSRRALCLACRRPASAASQYNIVLPIGPASTEHQAVCRVDTDPHLWQVAVYSHYSQLNVTLCNISTSCVAGCQAPVRASGCSGMPGQIGPLRSPGR